MAGVDFLEAALVLLKRGWLAQPLMLDDNGRPKRAITKAWTSMERSEETVRSMNWVGAAGIGLILGEQSSGLCVLDIDDEELFNVTTILLGPYSMRMVRTVSNHGHLYFQSDDNPGPSSVRQVKWRGRPVTVDLLASNHQATVPPTPPYTLLMERGLDMAQPLPRPNSTIETAFDWWFNVFQQELPGQLTIVPRQVSWDGRTDGRDDVFADHVPKGQRNNIAYREAIRLAEAKFSIDQIMHVMRSRFATDYETGDMSFDEIERTVKSAYAKYQAQKSVPRTYIHEKGRTDERHLFA